MRTNLGSRPIAIALTGLLAFGLLFAGFTAQAATDESLNSDADEASLDTETDAEPTLLAKMIASALHESWAPKFEAYVRATEIGETNRRYPDKLDDGVRRAIDEHTVNVAMTIQYGPKGWQLAVQELLDEQLSPDEVHTLEEALDSEAGRKLLTVLVSNGSLEWTRSRLMQRARRLQPLIEFTELESLHGRTDIANVGHYFGRSQISLCERVVPFTVRSSKGASVTSTTCALGRPQSAGSGNLLRIGLAANQSYTVQLEHHDVDYPIGALPVAIYQGFAVSGEEVKLSLALADGDMPSAYITLGAAKEPASDLRLKPLSVCVQNVPALDVLNRAAALFDGTFHMGVADFKNERVNFCDDGLSIQTLSALFAGMRDTLLCIDQDNHFSALPVDALPIKGAECKTLASLAKETRPKRSKRPE
ncbi:hypothetical protein C7S18_22515 [Ahniella affigens]|uniref:Uncharacterized protein n=1 Tax=Ahniella affigens TaxID=2021234 RepID=A0A2P1PY59_9GAMM|nr:hypothetical protein [Ahniella affigens]AVP99776.1 hypothetical protein C7S18_22515 [Ahniella affigens]